MNEVILPFKEGTLRDRDKEIHAVAWEIYTKDPEDLFDLVWNGELSWDFPGVKMPIGPLSMCSNSFFDLFCSQGALSDLEELARAKTEAEWRELLQEFRIGQRIAFRGLSRYWTNPIWIPRNSEWKVRLDFTEPFQPRDECRFRVILNGRWKSTVTWKSTVNP